MPNGFGGGRGGGWGRGGWGFGFRGSSPPWPYVGIGRGGLPRCGYFLSGAAGAPVPPAYGAYPYYGDPGAVPPYTGAPTEPMPGATPFYGGMPPGMPGATPYAPQMTREQELDFLRSQAEAIKGQLEQIGNRIKELEEE